MPTDFTTTHPIGAHQEKTGRPPLLPIPGTVPVHDHQPYRSYCGTCGRDFTDAKTAWTHTTDAHGNPCRTPWIKGQ